MVAARAATAAFCVGYAAWLLVCLRQAADAADLSEAWGILRLPAWVMAIAAFLAVRTPVRQAMQPRRSVIAHLFCLFLSSSFFPILCFFFSFLSFFFLHFFSGASGGSQRG
jgi:hypothetical protein